MTTYTLLTVAIFFMCCCAVFFIAARHWLPGLYVDDPSVISMAASLLVIAGFFQLADGVQVVCVAALRGIQDVKIPSIFILLAYWAVGLPLGYYLAFGLGMKGEGVWWGLFIGLMLTAMAMFVRLKKMIARLHQKYQLPEASIPVGTSILP